jgi:hypothetical protein
LINPSHEGDEKSSFSFPPPFSPELFQPSSVSLIKTYPKYLKLNPGVRSQNAGEEQTTMTVLVIAAFILDSGSWLLNSRESMNIEKC